MAPSRLLLIVLLLTGLASCITIKGIPLPAPDLSGVELPKLSSIKNIIPTSGDRVSSDDPDIPFDPRGTLRPGHTLRLEICESLRSSRTIWKGLALISLDGDIDLGRHGQVNLRGKTVPQAIQLISAQIRASGRTAAPIVTHIISIENTPLVTLEGDLAAGTQVIPVFEGISIAKAVQLSGGRRSSSTNRSLYLTRDGKRRFFRSIEQADQQWSIQPGDLITLSTDL